jgi:pentatricopeptide repeat-containing protein PET309
MLERATACVEPGISLFLKRIEKSTRSTRTLHPSFWRNRAEEKILTSAWWPAYLQDVREIASSQCRARLMPSNAVELVNDDIFPSSYRKPVSAAQRQRRNLSNGTRCGEHIPKNGRRTFSISQGIRSGTSTGPSTVGEGNDEQLLHGTVVEPDAPDAGRHPTDLESTSGTAAYSGGPVNMLLEERQLSPLESLRILLDSSDREAYGKVWQLFIRVGGQGELAWEILKYMSTSHHRVDLDHAIRAYKLIPAVNRALKDYQTAIKVACRRKQQRIAVEIHREAFERGFHTETTDTLLAFLVRSGLWKTAAQLWDRLPILRRSAANPRNRDLWSETDKYTALPGRLLQLIKRLEQNDAVFASERNQIFGLCVQLLYRIFSSSEIMASITGPATLALLDRFFLLGLLEPPHYFSAIQTLNKMAGFRNRHQLAILLYRNLDRRFPAARLPHSVLGSLIAILSESDSNHLASRVILRRFATDWGRPDCRAYQKVLSACAQNGDSANVHEVFTEFCTDYGIPTDIVYITPLLYVYARTGNFSETKKQFDRLRSEFKIEPNAYCWNILITAHAKARDHEGAFQAFQNMRQAGVKPDQRTYGILMGMCARSGDTRTVHQLVETARQQHITGTSAMVDSLVHSYCTSDQVEDAENLVEAATKMRLEASPTRMWNTLLRYHAFRADTDAVLQTQERMKEVSVAADGMTYATLMQALVNIGKTRDAANILRSLHFSNAITATVFHYSIVLYGFALENDDDMVAVVYNEMRERFPRVGLSARLSRLRSYLHMDTKRSQLRLGRALQGKPMNRGLHLTKTLDFLAETLLEVNQSDLATEDPQPGLGRRSPPEAFPSIYLEFLIAAYGRSGALDKAENLLSRYQVLMNTKHLKSASSTTSIHLLNAIMITLVQQKRYANVERYWNNALSTAIDKGRQRSLDLSDPLVEEDVPQPSVRPDAGNIGLQMSAGGSGDNNRNPFLERGDIRILAAHRHSLAAPLTQYMHSLGAQNLTANLPPLVTRLEEMGFSLTSKNWNHYLQLLSYSNDPELQLLAFRVFEEKLLPNMPPWQLMKRSKWSQRRIVDGSGDFLVEEPVQRKFLENFRPQTLVPTYWTMVYLGLALMKFQRRSLRGEEPGLALLRSQAPGSVTAVSRMPYLREKAQGLLLRGTTLKGEKEKRPRKLPKADRAGLRGSRSALDHIPLDFPHHEVNKVFKSEEVRTFVQPGVEPSIPIHFAEQISGEIQRSPLVLEAAGRYEREREYSRRARIEERDKNHLLEEMRRDAAQPREMADEKYGEPFFEVKLPGQQASLATENTQASAKQKRELLSTALDYFAQGKQKSPLPSTWKQVSDVRPAAVLSAARRPKDAAHLALLRRQRSRRSANPLKSKHQFKRGGWRKVVLALTAYQPPQRTSNRLRRAFTKNKAARQTRSASKRKIRPRGRKARLSVVGAPRESSK